ncbi:MAG: DUF4037 domain-containing protein [Bifidobacteriaceae bacterium]|nr:DUF4037 domain-containing protein [Bifidobacteriaceae bacterium]
MSENNNSVTNNTSTPMFSAQSFLHDLDSLFEQHQDNQRIEEFLQQSMSDAENAHDDAGLLTVLNETMGFYRSRGMHEENQWIVQRALELALRMRLEHTPAWTTTLINAATAMRAAKNYDQAQDLYTQALHNAQETLSPTSRELAALHNNLSMLYSETNQINKALEELHNALEILQSSSVNMNEDVDIATTHTNIALLLLEQYNTEDGSQNVERKNALEQAAHHAQTSLQIYHSAHAENSAHYASALAGYAQVLYTQKQYSQAVDLYTQALQMIKSIYGENSDYYQITLKNLQDAQAKTEKNNQEQSSASANIQQESTELDNTINSTQPSSTKPAYVKQHISGLELSQEYWETYGKHLIEEKYSKYASRIAAGLIGHGSECYGFDDVYSEDHDFGAGFCIWLDNDDYAAIGTQLQADYDALPQEFKGYSRQTKTPRAQGALKRVGVFNVEDFFTQITGFATAPEQHNHAAWLMLDEPTLAAATNGKIFYDPYGLVSKTRQSFKNMPDDVKLSLISRRLGMISQAGQYNFPRMLQREDGSAALLCLQEFTQATASLIFLINQPISVGYLPYYKWQFAALRQLSSRIATRLADITPMLERILQIASAACFGGAGFGEGGKGAQPAQEEINKLIAQVCEKIVRELQRDSLTTLQENFLEWHRPYVEEHIVSTDPCLHSL